MNIAFTKEVSADLSRKLEVINSISSTLPRKLTTQSDSTVKSCVVTFNCINPNLFPDATDFETGIVVYKKFNRSRGELLFTVKLNYKEVSKADVKDLRAIISESLLKSSSEIEALRIEQFDAITFIKKLVEAINNESVTTNSPEDHSISRFLPPKEKKPKKSQFIEDDEFWKIIDYSRLEAESTDKQVQHVVDFLKMQEPKVIVAFEMTLRLFIKKLYHWNVLALFRILSGTFSDDGFLYFRCKIILMGKDIFDNVLKNPDTLKTEINIFPTAERMLKAADIAFLKRLGENTFENTPSDVASDYFDYNQENYTMGGEKWKESDLYDRFPKLFMKYSRQ